MLSFMVVLSILNFSMLSFANRRVADYAERQQLLYDLQSATDRLRYEVTQGLVIEQQYQMDNGTTIEFNYSPIETIIVAENKNRQEDIILRGINPATGIDKTIF